MLGFKNIKNSGNKALTTKTGRNEAVSGITPRTVVKPIRDWRICVIGGAPDALPAMPNVTFEKGVNIATMAVLALPGTNPARLYRGLWANDQALLPIIDAGCDLPRADAVINAATADQIKQALTKITPICHRLDDVPGVPEEQREQFLALAMAFTRDTAINARFAPNRAQVAAYPGLTGIPVNNDVLRNLATDGFLGTRFFQRVHECSHCQSARLLAQEECESCHSSHIEPVPLVHHYSCGFQGLRPQFVQGERLVCPKCNERLRHYGVDYDISGELTHCHDCGHQPGDVDVGFTCMDCGQHTEAKDCSTRDIHHYDLTVDGRQAVLSGAMPGLLNNDGEPARIISVEEFDRLVVIERRRTKRSNRPHVVMRMTLQANGDKVDQLGLASLNSLYRQASTIAAERLRDSDLVAWRGPRVYMLMPDTPTENAVIVADKLGRAIADIFGILPDFNILNTEDNRSATVEASWLDLREAA